ncbi:hypothetical protein Tco_0006002 [Tanacetum coccineum]
MDNYCKKLMSKWIIEGEENSNSYHGLINQKRRNQMINGIMVEGNWITNPCLIKDAFLQFYKRKFQAQDSQVMFSNLPHSHSLNCMDRETLERQVTLEEIKEAVGLASILINGSPTSEFSIKRGLRQGDPLSPFLFILVMEGLHNAFEEAVGNGLITGHLLGILSMIGSSLGMLLKRKNTAGVQVRAGAGSPPDHPKNKSSLDASAKLTRAKPNKHSRDADLSKDKSGPKSPPEFRRSWCVEGHVRSGVISSVLMQRYLRTTRQRRRRIKLRRNQAEFDIHHR